MLMFLVNVILNVESVIRETPPPRRSSERVLDKVVFKGFYGGGSDSIKDVKPGFSKCDDVEFIRGDVLRYYIYVGAKGSIYICIQLMRQAVIELLLFVVSHVGLSCLLYFLMYPFKYLVQSVSWSSVGFSVFDLNPSYFCQGII